MDGLDINQVVGTLHKRYIKTEAKRKGFRKELDRAFKGLDQLDRLYRLTLK